MGKVLGLAILAPKVPAAPAFVVKGYTLINGVVAWTTARLVRPVVVSFNQSTPYPIPVGSVAGLDALSPTVPPLNS